MTARPPGSPHAAVLAERSEVLVVGAGPAGAVTALLLARCGARVTLVGDAAPRDPRPIVGEVLPPPVRPAFARLALDALVADPAHGQVPGSVASWGPGPPLVTDHLRSPFGEAVQLDRSVFERDLVRAAATAGARVVDVPRATWAAWTAALSGGGRPGPRVVVDATGRAAALTRASGATVERADRLVAVVGVLSHVVGDASDERRLLIAAEDQGWWSSMVLPDGRRIAAFHTDHDRLPRVLRTDPGAWLARLRGVSLIGSVVRAERLAAPAGLRVVAAGSHRSRDADPRMQADRARPPVVAAGDAEMAFDPLSSFGILGAISSGEEAVGVITAMLDGRGGPSGTAAREALATREAARDARWNHYRERLALAYGDETRWPDARFWGRRRPVAVARP